MGGNDRFCARLKVPPFSLKYEWQFWSKYCLQIFFSSVAISLKKNWYLPGSWRTYFIIGAKKKKKNDLWLLPTAAKKPIDISDQGKFRQKMSLYLTS
jgi:hypothetical protein